jgi:CBS domain-containing membrane protein
MIQSKLQWLLRIFPVPSSVDRYEKMRACAGALFGLVLTGLTTYLILGKDVHAMWLIAPMGASSVLLFAVPASPLAQPWSIMGGNIIAAIIGVTCAKLIGEPILAAGLAAALAIAGMFAFRCIHPPSGAVALTAVLGGPAVYAMGYSFVLIPVALNSLLLLLTALFFNNATGRRYPHVTQPDRTSKHNTTDAPPTERIGITPSDLDTVLTRYNQVLDISRADLESIMLQTEMQAYRRRMGEVKCSSIMSKDVVTVEFGTELAEAWAEFKSHDLTALPVIDRGRRVIGIVTKADFLHHAEMELHEGLGQRLSNLLRPSQLTHTEKHEVVGQIMSKEVYTASADQSIVDLVPLMSDSEVHQMPVIDGQGRLVGMISQTDMIAALFEHGLAEGK